MSLPLVTVVTATYNRSNVLRWAAASVRWQTVADWEMLVVGDACTDDTAETLAGLGDRRIVFHNLPENCGEQSGPNNFGSRRARGKYLAYLNHDDLWLPHHLETAVAALESTGADLVFTLLDIVRRGRENRLQGATPSGRYEPDYDVPCSCWVMRRALFEQVGGWRPCRQCFAVPSQDFLFRAYRAGKDLRLAPALTVVAFQSGSRPNGYALREDEEQRVYFERIRRERDFVERELTAMHVTAAQRARRSWWRRWALAAGWHPLAVRQIARLRRRGAKIDELRRIRGLPPLPRSARQTAPPHLV